MSAVTHVRMCTSGMCAFTFSDALKVSFSCRADGTAERKRQRRGATGGRGLGVVLHLGWSVSHCGKTQYLHFVIRTTFTLSFSTTRIYAHLTGEGGSVRPNDLHLFVTAGRSGQRWMCACVFGMMLRKCLGSFMKAVLFFESCAPDVIAELLSLR